MIEIDTIASPDVFVCDVAPRPSDFLERFPPACHRAAFFCAITSSRRCCVLTSLELLGQHTHTVTTGTPAPAPAPQTTNHGEGSRLNHEAGAPSYHKKVPRRH